MMIGTRVQINAPRSTHNGKTGKIVGWKPGNVWVVQIGEKNLRFDAEHVEEVLAQIRYKGTVVNGYDADLGLQFSKEVDTEHEFTMALLEAWRIADVTSITTTFTARPDHLD